jgi:hypothetical protein
MDFFVFCVGRTQGDVTAFKIIKIKKGPAVSHSIFSYILRIRCTCIYILKSIEEEERKGSLGCMPISWYRIVGVRATNP